MISRIPQQFALLYEQFLHSREQIINLSIGILEMGAVRTAQNPNHFYSDYGHFIPKLYLVGAGGCIDSAEASVSIYDPIATTQLNYGPLTTACNSLNVDFNFVVPPNFNSLFSLVMVLLILLSKLP